MGHVVYESCLYAHSGLNWFWSTTCDISLKKTILRLLDKKPVRYWLFYFSKKVVFSLKFLFNDDFVFIMVSAFHVALKNLFPEVDTLSELIKTNGKFCFR